MTSQKVLVEQLRDLARDPDHQAALVANAECLRSLEKTLNSMDPEVVSITLDTLTICSQTFSNRAILYEVPKLRDTLYYLSTEHPKPRIRLKANQLLTEIEPEPEADSITSYEDSGSLESNFTARYVRKQLHTVEIRIGNVKTSQQREKFQADAVKFNGVVSATMDYQMKRATIYTTLPNIKEDLIVHLTRSGYAVLSPEHGFRYKEKDNFEDYSLKAGQRQAPAYLQPKQEQNTMFDNPYALGRFNPGTKTETLADRLARFKKERAEAEKKKKQSVLSTVVNWFW